MSSKCVGLVVMDNCEIAARQKDDQLDQFQAERAASDNQGGHLHANFICHTNLHKRICKFNNK